MWLNIHVEVREQRTFGSQFFISTMCDLGIDHSSLGVKHFCLLSHHTSLVFYTIKKINENITKELILVLITEFNLHGTEVWALK